MRVKGDPLAVGRPRHGLVFRVGSGDHFRGFVSGDRLRQIDDADLLRDIGILRIVHDPAPGAISEGQATARRMERRRFRLERRELTRGAATCRHVGKEGAIRLDLEDRVAVGGHRRRVGIARKRRPAARAALRRIGRPQLHHPLLVGRREEDLFAIGREAERTDHVEIRIEAQRRCATGNRQPWWAAFVGDAGDVARRRPRRRRRPASERRARARHAIGRDAPQLCTLLAGGERHHRLRIRAPRGLAQVIHVLAVPQRLAHDAVGREVIGLPANRRSGVFGDQHLVAGPGQVTNLPLTRRQRQRHAAANRQHADVSAFGVGEARGIGRDHPHGIAIADDAKLVGGGEVGQAWRLTAQLHRGPGPQQGH